jgi:hypothetical protein
VLHIPLIHAQVAQYHGILEALAERFLPQRGSIIVLIFCEQEIAE